MPWFFSSGWLVRRFEKVCRGNKPRPARKWVKQIQPICETLEPRRLLNNNVWLPQRLAPLDGVAQYNQASQLFLMATTGLEANVGLQATTVSAAGSFSLTDSGHYSLSLTRSGPYDGNGDVYSFSASGPVTFSLVELGSYTNSAFSTNSITLTQTASLAWSFVEKDGSGQTLQNLSGTESFTVQNSGGAPFDPYFAAGFNWLSAVQKVSDLNSLNLSSLAADSLSVTETSGSDSYTFLKTNGLATVQGNVQVPLSDTLGQSGLESFSATRAEQSGATFQGGDSFSLTELGQYANNSFALSSVAYQETGNQSFQLTGTATETHSGTASSTRGQTFSGNNHTLGDSGSDSFQLSSLSTASYSESGSGTYTLTQSGSFSGGSFSLGSLNYNHNGTGNYTLTKTTAQTQTGTISASSNVAGTDSYGVSGSLTDNSTATQGGPFTYTASDTLQDAESGNYTLTQLGAYGNGCWALSSFNLTESLSGSFSVQHLGTLTTSGNNTTTESGATTDNYALGYGAVKTISAIGTSSSTGTTTASFSRTATDSSSQSGNSSYTLSLLGAASGGSYSLSSVVFSAGQSGSWAVSNHAEQTTTGTSHQTATSSGSGNQCFNTGGVSGNDLRSDSSSSSDSYSFTVTESSTSTDSAGFSQSQYRAGVYNSGSYSFSTDSFTRYDTYTWSFDSIETETDSGSSHITSGGSGQNNGTVSYGGGSSNRLGTETGTQTRDEIWSNSSVRTVHENGIAQSTFSQAGSYGGFSFTYGSVTYEISGGSHGTATDLYTGTYEGTVTESITSSGNQTTSGTTNLTAATGLGAVVRSVQETYSVSETILSGDTRTYDDAWSLYEQGSFSQGSWSLGSVNYSEGFSSDFNVQETDQVRSSGSDSYSLTGTTSNNAATAYGGGAFNGLETILSNSSGSDSFTDNSLATLTQNGVSYWSTIQKGTFGGGSFNLSSVVNEGNQSFSSTLKSADTYSFEGTANDSSTVQGHGLSSGVFAGSAESGVNSSTQHTNDHFSSEGSSVYRETVTASDCSTFYQAGQFAGNSFNLSSVNYGESYSAAFSYSGGDTQTASGNLTTNNTASGNGIWDINTNFASGSFGLTETITGNDATTSTDSYNGSGSQAWSLRQKGVFSNFSASFDSVVYIFDSYLDRASGSSASALTASSSDSFSGSRTLARSATDAFYGTLSNGPSGSNGRLDFALGDNESKTVTSQDTLTESYTSSDSWQMYEAGSSAGGNYNLSSVSYREDHSDSSSVTATGSLTEIGQQTHTSDGTIAYNDVVSYGNDVVMHHGTDTITTNQAVTGTQTITSSETTILRGGSSWSLSEAGSYSGYSYSLSSVVYQGTQTSSGTYQQQESSDYDGAFSGIANECQHGNFALPATQGTNSAFNSNTVHGTVDVEEVDVAGHSLTDHGSSASPGTSRAATPGAASPSPASAKV